MLGTQALEARFSTRPLAARRSVCTGVCTPCALGHAVCLRTTAVGNPAETARATRHEFCVRSGERWGLRPMPNRQLILDGLGTIANEGVLAAVGWHVLIACMIFALFMGWMPQKRSAALLLVVPLSSVSLAAATHGNPFNMFTVGVGALALVLLGLRLPRAPVTRGNRIQLVAGIFGIVVGSSYPHFLAGHSPAFYLIAAPVGLLPCPTLAMIMGFALLGGGFHSRAWSSVLAALGFFYGVFGAFRLDVWLDFSLVGEAFVLLGSVWLPHPRFAVKVRTPRAL